MRKSLVVGVVAAIAWSPAMADPHWSRPPGAAVTTHRTVAPPAHHHHHDYGHAALRPSVVIRYVPVVRVTTPTPTPTPTPYPGSLPRLAVPVSAPYFVVSGSLAAPEIMTFAEPESLQNWNWTRVDSVAALVPRKVGSYCPDSREYFPAVEICASPWVKIAP